MYILVEATMAVTLQKWGNSLGVRLPKTALEQVGLIEGAKVEVGVEGDHLVIRRQRLNLAELLAACKPENRPDPIDFGPPVGRELI
jgi:antitoxin MazE